MKKAYLLLRWEVQSEDTYLCYSELIIPLGPEDVRRDIWENNEKVGRRSCLNFPMDIGPVRRTSGSAPCINSNGEYYFDVPYRAGVHAQWDSKRLGGIPVRVMALDRTLMEMVDNKLVLFPAGH